MSEILPANNELAIQKALELLQRGDVVVYPTDTIYGLATSITSKTGIQKIYRIKSRSREKPLMLHIATFEQFQNLTRDVPEKTLDRLRKIWPGAMAGIFLKNDTLVPSYVTSGKETICLRIPDNSLCMELVKRVGHPLAVTSANISGMETPKTADHIATQLGAHIPLVLDGGPSQHDHASTLIDFTGQNPKLLREGALSIFHLRTFLPNLEIPQELGP
ncbi:threonylcarbamoyl-AMP synthase [Candidatus Endobugula sertula]|uniref:L-threonylcarbamoyladenylate synthase n=1 Tax=Candidatus Endobugula sertula TaxID=62101 RepID=A0A1D2QRC3_9GAMM|nr:threonylcarbamoyl-AMP synthase [Candidatus Endobugula sertula]